MKLEQTIHLAKLKETTNKVTSKVISAKALSAIVFKTAAELGCPIESTRKEWRERWLASDKFVLTEIEAGSAAVPKQLNNGKQRIQKLLLASAESMPPIVVDVNKQKLRTTLSGYTPKLLVVDGADQYQASALQGRTRIKAYVGVKAIEHVNRNYSVEPCDQCKHPIRNMSKIDIAASVMNSVPRQDVADNKQSAPHKPMPSFVEDRGVLNPKPEVIKASALKVGDKLIRSGCVFLLASVKASQDRPGYVNVWSTGNGNAYFQYHQDDQVQAIPRVAAAAGPSGSSLGTGSGPAPMMKIASEATTQTQKGNGIGPRLVPNKGAGSSELNNRLLAKGTTVKELWNLYTEAVKGGYKPNITAKAPEGWEGTVKQMKKHSDISNPWALSHWMKDQGMSPHHMMAAIKASI